MPPLILLVAGVGSIFLALIVLLMGLGVFSTARLRAAQSLALIEAYGKAPTSMQAELEPDFNERIVTPLMKRFSALGHRLTPADSAERIHEKIEAAGNPNGVTTDRIIAAKAAGFAALLLVSVMVCMVAGLGVRPTLGITVVASLAGYLAPNFWLYQKAYDRAELSEKALPDALDMLTISVEAGLGFDAALAQVARNTEGPLADELARLLQEMQLGAGRSEALRRLGSRTTLPDLKGFVTAMVQADAFGIPIGQVLRVQSKEMRVKRRQRAEEKAQKVPVKILFPLIFCILPVLFITVMGPGVIAMITQFTGTGLG